MLAWIKLLVFKAPDTILSKPGSMLAWIKLLVFKAPDQIQYFQHASRFSKPGSMLAWIKLLVFKAPDTITKTPDIKGILSLRDSHMPGLSQPRRALSYGSTAAGLAQVRHLGHAEHMQKGVELLQALYVSLVPKLN